MAEQGLAEAPETKEAFEERGDMPGSGAGGGQADEKNAEASSVQETLSALEERQEALKKQIFTVEKEREKETEALLRSRRRAVAEPFDERLRQLEEALRRIEEKRQQAREKGVRARISEETAALSAERKELKTALSNLSRDEKLPLICRNALFYILIMPHGISEYFGALFGFLMVFAALPFLLYACLSPAAGWVFGVIYLLDILVFGGLWMLLHEQKVRYPDALKKSRELRNRLSKNRKQILKKTRAIRRDRDDTAYDLRSYDDLLTQRTQEREEEKGRRAEALLQFDTVTKNVLSDEVAQKYEEDISALTEQLLQLQSKTKELEEKIRHDGKTDDNQGDF